MTQRRRRIVIALAVAGAAVVAVATGARTLLPSWLRGSIEEAASRALGRDLRIAGPFDLSFSLTPRITAGDITLANVSWGSEPSIVRVGRLTVVVDLVSLWSGPVRVRELTIEDVRLLLEADGEGGGNWVFVRPPAPNGPSGPAERPPVVFDRAAIRGFEMLYRPRPDAPPLTLGVRELEAQLDPGSRMIEIRGDGRFDGAPWEVAGRLGTLERLYDVHDIDHALAGSVGTSTFEIRGRIRDPLDLGGPDLEVSAGGPDIVAALGHFGLRSPLSGPFQLRGRFTSATEGVDLDVKVAAGGVHAGARGVVSKLSTFDRMDVAVEAAGPDASEVGSWFGVEGLPPRPFDLAGRVRREDGRIAVDDAELRVGPTSLGVTGFIGAPPRWVGTDLSVRASGKDLSELSPVTGLSLPSGPFEIEGRILRRADALTIDAAELRFRDARLRADGTLGEPPSLPDLDLTVDATGPDLAWFSEVAGIELPQRPFALRGRVAREGAALALHAVEGRLGDDTVSLSGRLVPAKRLEGTDVEVRVAGSDLTTLASLLGLHRVPAEPFDLRGRVRVGPRGYDLDGVEGSVGRVAATVEGRIGAPPALEGTSLSGRAQGTALSDLAAWGLPEMLPADPFSIEGRIRIEKGVYRADRVVANVGPDHAGFDGVLGALPDLSLLDGEAEASGPRLAGLERFFAAAGLAATGRLPDSAYAAAGRVRRLPSGYELRELFAKAGDATVRVNGTVGTGEDFLGTDLRFEADGPDTSLLSSLAGTALPEGPFEARGRLARVETGFLCDGVAVDVGGAHAEASGTLGAWPELEGTDLRIDASGPDLAAALGPVTGLPVLPSESFEIQVELAGNADRFASKRLSARLGASDLEGSLSIRLDGRPVVQAELRSRHLDLSGLLAGFGVEPAEASPGTGTTEPPRKNRRLISDKPLGLAALRNLDATMRFDAGEMVIRGAAFRDIVVEGGLRDGALRVDRFEGLGRLGGRATASLVMEPLGGGYRLRTAGRLDGGRLALSKGETSAENTLPLDIEFDLEGSGASLHEIAASGNGDVLVVLGSGRVPNALRDGLTSGVLRGLLDALNPLRESSDHTEVECGIAAAFVTGGKTAVEPIAARTDKMTVLGRGKVDFDTEEIEFTWTLKPRKGVGISASSITNPYIKLGGTLASPSLDMKPIDAVASTGAAVATAGLTLFARGIYDRITAEKKVCASALEKARKKAEQRRLGLASMRERR